MSAHAQEGSSGRGRRRMQTDDVADEIDDGDEVGDLLRAGREAIVAFGAAER